MRSPPIHANAALLHRLFTALREHDHAAMASCYRPDARFRDIAFDLRGRERIHDMWRMICKGGSDIEVVDFEIVEANDLGGRVRLVEKYRFGASKDPPKEGTLVRNAIESRFLFEGGKIQRQDDDCDPEEWAKQAMADRNPVVRLLAGRFRLLRSVVASAKLTKFLKKEREQG